MLNSQSKPLAQEDKFHQSYFVSLMPAVNRALPWGTAVHTTITYTLSTVSCSNRKDCGWIFLGLGGAQECLCAIGRRYTASLKLPWTRTPRREHKRSTDRENLSNVTFIWRLDLRGLAVSIDWRCDCFRFKTTNLSLVEPESKPWVYSFDEQWLEMIRNHPHTFTVSCHSWNQTIGWMKP